MSAPSAIEPQPAPTAVVVPSLSELFLGFLKCSVSGFGGVLPWARRMIVEERHWMSAQEFNEGFALAQFLPGPNIVNFAVVFGARICGRLGAVVAVIGLLGPPTVIVTALGVLYARYSDLEILRHALTGIAAAAAGLLIAMVLKMVEPVLRHRFRPGPVVMVAVFIAFGILRLPLIVVLGAVAPVSVALAWWWVRK
jgi:chromate transporter